MTCFWNNDSKRTGARTGRTAEAEGQTGKDQPGIYTHTLSTQHRTGHITHTLAVSLTKQVSSEMILEISENVCV